MPGSGLLQPRVGREDMGRPNTCGRAMLVVAFFAALSPATPASGSDEIVALEAALAVRRDGSVRVTERIRLRAFGREGAPPGLVRTIPTSFSLASGFGRMEAPVRIIAVTCDGKPHSFSMTAIGRAFSQGAIRLSTATPQFSSGTDVHTVGIAYETERWIRHGDLDDTLIWNVTGGGFDLPIASATASVHVEGLDRPLAMQALSGSDEATLQPGWTKWKPGGPATFGTLHPLAPGDSFEIRLTLPKWIVSAPTFSRETQWFWLDWGGWIDAACALAAIAAWYALVWYRVGRDGVRGPVVVRYEPPDGHSPAALGFLRDRRFRARHFAACVASLAAQGVIRIRDDGQSVVLERSGSPRGSWPEEARVFQALFSAGCDRITPRDHQELERSAAYLERELRRGLERVYLRANRRWFAAGLVSSIVSLVVVSLRWRAPIDIAVLPLALLWTGLCGIAFSLLVRLVRGVRHARAGGGRYALIGTAGLVFALLPVSGFVLVFGDGLLSLAPTHLVVLAGTLGLVNALFYHLLERPTLRALDVLQQTEGFRCFLAATEEDRLDLSHSPETIPATIDRRLPYVIGLGLSSRLGRHLEHAFTPLAEPPAGG